MQWEFELLYVLQEIHTPVLDRMMAVLSDLGNAGLIWIMLSVILALIPKYRVWGIRMLAAIVLTFLIGNLIIKNLVARARPCWIDPSVPLLVKSPSDYSFPSGHTMNGFTTAWALFRCNKRAGAPALLFAAAIAFSRLYNFVHFPTDVLCGLVLGIAGAEVSGRIVDSVNKMRNQKQS